MSERPTLPRFDGTAAWQTLDPLTQAAIGAMALELVAAWHASDVLEHDVVQHRPEIGAVARAIDQAEAQLSEQLQEAVHTALPAALAAITLPLIPSSLGMVCTGCGCSENDACDLGCAWAAEDLCTACAPSSTTER